MLPLYKQLSVWGIMDSYTSVMLPFLAHASTIFFFRQYLQSLPKSLLEAGRIDGASEYGNNYDLLMVGCFFSVVPIFILFICFQKYFIEGMTAGAVKG